MQVTQSIDRIQKAAEAALSRIDVEGLPPTPALYRLWYTHFMGDDPMLSRAIGILETNRERLTEERCNELIEHFLSDAEGEVLRRSTDQLQTIIEDTLATFSSSKADTAAYGKQLNRFGGVLDAAARLEELRSVVGQLASETKRMITHNETLQDRLTEKTNDMDRMKRDLDSIKLEALTDALTSIGNRKSFDITLRASINQALEDGGAVSLMMLDIDHFKRFNDTYGHATGDKVLMLVARTLTDSIKGRDHASRYGGEEFAIILPNTTIENAMKVADDIRCAIADRQIIRRDSQESLGSITVSIGVAEYRPGERLIDFVERADRGLYEAKRTGRNRVALGPATPGTGASPLHMNGAAASDDRGRSSSAL